MAAEIQFNVDAALAKLGELVAKHGPDAVNLAAQVVQINAVQTLLTGAASAVILGVAVKAFGFFARRQQAAYAEDDIGLPMIGWLLVLLGDLIAGGIATAYTLGDLLDVWAWVALFNPKLALAHEVLAKLTGA